MIGFNEDGLGADGSTAYSCSFRLWLHRVKKRVVLVEGWNYIQSKYPGDCQGCEANNITVSLTGLPPASLWPDLHILPDRVHRPAAVGFVDCASAGGH